MTPPRGGGWRPKFCGQKNVVDTSISPKFGFEPVLNNLAKGSMEMEDLLENLMR